MPEAQGDVRPGDVLTLSLDGIGWDGVAFSGAGRSRVWVRGGRPGDVVEVRITGRERGRTEGKIERVVQPGFERMDPGCPHFGVCGGCLWLDVPYDRQLAWKRDYVRRCFGERGMTVEVAETLPSPETTFYRNRMDFSFAQGHDGALMLGLYADREQERRAGRLSQPRAGMAPVFDVTDCRLMSERANRVVAEARRFLQEARLRAYDPERRTGVLRSLVLRESKRTGQWSAQLTVASAKLVPGEAMARALSAVGAGFKGLVVAVNRRRSRQAPARELLSFGGDGAVDEPMGGLTLRSEAEAFVQVNTSQAERLYAVAAEWAGGRPGMRALDLYSGAGGLALTLAKAGAEVTGVELSEPAVAAASRSAAGNGLSGRCRFAAGDATRAGSLFEGRCDLVTLNPPRAGAEPAVLGAVTGIGPERVVYVSCNPETLARDAGRLIHQGYRLCGLQPVDMFPHTGHVEVVARFERVGSGSRDGSW